MYAEILESNRLTKESHLREEGFETLVPLRQLFLWFLEREWVLKKQAGLEKLFNFSNEKKKLFKSGSIFIIKEASLIKNGNNILLTIIKKGKPEDPYKIEIQNFNDVVVVPFPSKWLKVYLKRLEKHLSLFENVQEQRNELTVAALT